MHRSDAREKVIEHKPQLAALFHDHGNTSLSEYYQNTHIYRADNTLKQKELIDVVTHLTKERLGETCAEKIRAQLTENFAVGTADHHGVLSHPFFSNNALMQSFTQSVIPIFSFAGISLDNSSYPRGIVFHDETGVWHRLPFVALKHHHHPVYGYETNLGELHNHALKALPKLHLSKTLEQKVITLVNELLPDSANDTTYESLLTKSTHKLFQKITGKDLIYIDSESIVRELLLTHHLESQTPINAIIFDTFVRDDFLKYFDGIDGAHTDTKNHGTHLFWGINNNERIQLHAGNNALISSDGVFTIPLTPTAVAEALRNKKIYPNMALVFCVLTFYYGLRTDGGFCQINYLTDMKEAWNQLAQIHQDKYFTPSTTPTDIFRGEFVLATLKTNTDTIPATLIDVLLYGSAETIETIKTLGENTKLEIALDAMLPEFYKIVTGETVAITDLPIIPPTLTALN